MTPQQKIAKATEFIKLGQDLMQEALIDMEVNIGKEQAKADNYKDMLFKRTKVITYLRNHEKQSGKVNSKSSS